MERLQSRLFLLRLACLGLLLLARPLVAAPAPIEPSGLSAPPRLAEKSLPSFPSCDSLVRFVRAAYAARDPLFLEADPAETGCSEAQQYQILYYQGFGHFFLGRYELALFHFESARSLGGPWDEQLLRQIWQCAVRLGHDALGTEAFREMERRFPRSASLPAMRRHETRWRWARPDLLGYLGTGYGSRSYQGFHQRAGASVEWAQEKGAWRLEEELSLDGIRYSTGDYRDEPRLFYQGSLGLERGGTGLVLTADRSLAYEYRAGRAGPDDSAGVEKTSFWETGFAALFHHARTRAAGEELGAQAEFSATGSSYRLMSGRVHWKDRWKAMGGNTGRRIKERWRLLGSADRRMFFLRPGRCLLSPSGESCSEGEADTVALAGLEVEGAREWIYRGFAPGPALAGARLYAGLRFRAEWEEEVFRPQAVFVFWNNQPLSRRLDWLVRGEAGGEWERGEGLEPLYRVSTLLMVDLPDF